MPFEYHFPKMFDYRDGLLAVPEHEAARAAALALRDELPQSSRANLYTTYGSVANVLERAELAPLRLALQDEILLCLERLETRAGQRAVVSDAWISISSPGNFERMHTHGGAYLSGVYYIQTGPDCGKIGFEQLDDNLWASRRTARENWNSVSFEAVEGRLILFNSQVPHHVSQNMGATERIALSFNVALV
jgi:uncharacterized protein (TIGR02466 family)